MKIGLDTIAFAQGEINLATAALSYEAQEDVLSQRVLDYLCGLYALTNATHTLRRRYLLGPEVTLESVIAELADAGEVYLAIRDDFMVGALKGAVQILRDLSVQAVEDGGSEITVAVAELADVMHDQLAAAEADPLIVGDLDV